jgi:hypothetical protein
MSKTKTSQSHLLSVTLPIETLTVLSDLVNLLSTPRESRPEAINDALDGALGEVLEAIEKAAALHWETATQPAVDWTIPVTITFKTTQEDH